MDQQNYNINREEHFPTTKYNKPVNKKNGIN